MRERLLRAAEDKTRLRVTCQTALSQIGYSNFLKSFKQAEELFELLEWLMNFKIWTIEFSFPGTALTRHGRCNVVQIRT
jgi:hypothetical protein